MDWLTHNPIANMYGPHFLILYGIVIVLTLIVCWWVVRGQDSSRSRKPPPVAAEPDAFEVAYLRGGEKDVANLIVFDLVRRGYLELDSEQRR